MIKKTLMVLGGIFVVIIFGVGALLFWAHQTGKEAQEKFYTAVESGDTEKVMALLAPNLLDEVDSPMMAAWMKALTSNLGPYKGLSGSDFRSSSKYENGHSRIESAGMVDFEKGSARSELIYIDGKLAGFHITSPQLPDDWFHGPATTGLYRSQGQSFLTELFNGNTAAALAKTQANFQKKMSVEEVKKDVDEAIAAAGPLKSIDFQSEKTDPHDGYVLIIAYAVHGERKEMTATVDFRFAGLKGAIVGYDLGGGGR